MLTTQYAKGLKGIRVNAADPGYTATDINGHSGSQTLTEGTDAIVALATEEPGAAPDASSTAMARSPGPDTGGAGSPALKNRTGRTSRPVGRENRRCYWRRRNLRQKSALLQCSGGGQQASPGC